MTYNINDKFKAKSDILDIFANTIKAKKDDVCEIHQILMGGISTGGFYLSNNTLGNGVLFLVTKEALDDIFERVNDNFDYAMAIV